MVDLDNNGKVVAKFLNGRFRAKRSYINLSRIEVELEKVDVNTVEFALETLRAGGFSYTDLPTSGLTKDIFLENRENVILGSESWLITRNDDGKIFFRSPNENIPRPEKIEWPEPQNARWREQVMSAYSAEAYHLEIISLLKNLFGPDFKADQIKSLMASIANEKFDDKIIAAIPSFVESFGVAYTIEMLKKIFMDEAKSAVLYKGQDFDSAVRAVNRFFETLKSEIEKGSDWRAARDKALKQEESYL